MLMRHFLLRAMLLFGLVSTFAESAYGVGGSDGSGGNINLNFVNYAPITLSSGTTDIVSGFASYTVSVSNHTNAIFQPNSGVNPYADILSAVTVLDTSHLTSNGATFSASYSSGGFTTSTEIGLTATDQSTVSINDGTLQTFISSGGFCTDTAIGLKAMSSATVQVSGGTFGGFASSGGDSTDISCGLLATDNSTVFITGGHFRDGGPASSGGSAYADIIAAGASKVSITGGSFAGLLGQNNAQVTIYGSGFNYPAGGVRDLTGTITGTLQDGETLNLSFIQDRAGQIVLSQVPEPAAVSLLRTCVALSVRRRSGAALGSMNFEHWS